MMALALSASPVLYENFSFLIFSFIFFGAIFFTRRLRLLSKNYLHVIVLLVFYYYN